MATTSPDLCIVERGPSFTSPQLFWLVVQATALVGLIFWQVSADMASIAPFWHDPLGIKLAVGAATFIVLNFGALLGGMYVLNQLATSTLRDQGVLCRSLQGCLCAGCFLFFYLPACFVLLIGPSVLAINATLTQS